MAREDTALAGGEFWLLPKLGFLGFKPFYTKRLNVYHFEPNVAIASEAKNDSRRDSFRWWRFCDSKTGSFGF